MWDLECSLEKISEVYYSQPDPVPSPLDSCGPVMGDPVVIHLSALALSSFQPWPGMGPFPQGAATPASRGRKHSASSPVKFPGIGEVSQADKIQGPDSI